MLFKKNEQLSEVHRHTVECGGVLDIQCSVEVLSTYSVVWRCY